MIRIRPVEAELINACGLTHRRTDTQTDMMKLIMAFRNFVNAPKKKKRRENKSLLINSISNFLARSLCFSSVTDCGLDF
jgi:hypothetical protein